MNALRTCLFVAALLSPAAVQAAPWTFTNDAGLEVTLDAVPARIIASQDAAAGLIPLGIRPVGIYIYGPQAEQKALQGLDLTGIEILGVAWGEVDFERAAALEPDLIVDEYWPATSEWGSGADLVGPQGTLAALAPVVGVANGNSVQGIIEDYEVLATSLGAAPTDGEADKDRFIAAQAAFQTGVAAKPNLTVLAISPRTEAMYVATPVGTSELEDFRAWGLNIVVPEVIDYRGYFENLSWENADKYQTDLVIVDNRSPATLASAVAQPTWTTLKAAEAGAVAEWPAYWLRNYGAYAGELEKLTAAINAADENLTD